MSRFNLMQEINAWKGLISERLSAACLPRGANTRIQNSLAESELPMNIRTIANVVDGGTNGIDSLNPKLNNLLAILLLMEQEGCSISLDRDSRLRQPNIDTVSLQHAITDAIASLDELGIPISDGNVLADFILVHYKARVIGDCPESAMEMLKLTKRTILR